MGKKNIPCKWKPNKRNSDTFIRQNRFQDRNPISTKNTNTTWAWWYVPVVLATQEAEAGESLEPGRQRLQ